MVRVDHSCRLVVLTWLFGSIPSSRGFMSSMSLSFGAKDSVPTKPPDNVKCLILPGFGNDQTDYFLKQAPQGSLVQSLQDRGWTLVEPEGISNNSDVDINGDNDRDVYAGQIRVLPVRRSDWLRVFLRGATDPKFWGNEAAATGPAFSWYLNLIAQEINALCALNEDTRVVLLGHSAGGWLGRAALGYCGQSSTESNSTVDKDDKTDLVTFPLEKVLGLVTLGTPHLPPPPSVMDMTRGALRLTHEQFPNAYYAPKLFYITAMGQSVTGVKQEKRFPWEPDTSVGFAYNSYEIVSGEGATLGDGVVPFSAGHLEGAQNIDLPGVLHSINAPDNWYGSADVIDSWHSPMLKAIQKVNRKQIAPAKSPKSLWQVPQLFSSKQ